MDTGTAPAAPAGLRGDLGGRHYTEVLRTLHETLRPRTYLEIGVFRGDTLALATCRFAAVDPDFRIEDPATFARLLQCPQASFFRMTSDAFFAAHDPAAILGGPIDMAFLDGLHQCEALLRDLANVERHCRRNAVVCLHDCLPVEPAIATRAPFAAHPLAPHRRMWWTGDVWRTALLLRRVRPDLEMTVLDARPTGLVLITNLDAGNTLLTRDYPRLVREMMSWSLEEMGVDALFAELRVEPTAVLASREQIGARFWL